MKKSVKFSPEVLERAVRMGVDARGPRESQWAAMVSIAAKIGWRIGNFLSSDERGK